MSGPGRPDSAGPPARRPPPASTRPGNDGHGHVPARSEAAGLPRLAGQIVPLPAAGSTADPARPRAGRRQRHLCRHRAQDPGRGDQRDRRGRHQPVPARRHHPGTGHRGPARPGPGPARRHAVGHDADARRGHRLRRAGRDPRAAHRRVRHQLDLRLAAGIHHGRRHPADGLPAANAGRRKARPAAAALLRQPPARRPAESRHQRHRQHRHVTAAEPDPAHHLAADDRLRAGPDGDDQPDPGPDLDPDRARIAHRDDPHRAAIAEAVRRPMGVDRGAQRARRGDAHRARHRQGVRTPARGDRDVRCREREALPGQLPSAVHLRNHPTGDELHLQPQLRRDRGHRRPARGIRSDVARRRGRLHPVLAPVHLPDHPDRQHRQRAPVGRRVCGARVPAPRRAGGDRGAGDTGRVRGARRCRGAARCVLPLRAGQALDRRLCRWTWRQARRWPSWGRPAPARRRSSTC